MDEYNSYPHMQKELKSLDRQLRNNSLVRIPDTTQKHENSIFRALAMAVLHSHQYHQEIISDIKLTLISNLGQKRNNPFPIVHQNSVLKKYLADSDLILDFWDAPDLTCFHNDVLIIASAAFAKSVCIYSLDKDEYLNETYISACKNTHEEKLCLAKVAKKYYAVLKMPTKQIIPWVKDDIIGSIVNSIFEEEKEEEPREDRIHFPNYDDVNNRHARQHKKSLSDCGDLPLQIESYDERTKQFEQNSQGGDRGSYPPVKLYDRIQEQFFDNTGYLQQGYTMDNTRDQYPNYYGYNYQHYGFSQEQNLQNFSYIESTPVNNVRYTGRLKFFDQNGNYGFIVIDNLNTDLFVHFDDLSKAGIAKQKLLSLKNHYQLRFEFTYYEYEGKQHKRSKKAVDLVLLQE